MIGFVRSIRRISTRDQLVLIGAVIVASIIGGTWLIISMQRQAAIEAFQIATMNIANGMSRQTAHFFTQADQLLSTTDHRVTAEPGLDPSEIDARMASPAIFGLLWQELSRVSGVAGLTLVGADGVVVNDAKAWPAAPVNVSGRDYFRYFKAQDDPAPYVGAPEQDPEGGGWVVPLARRIDGAHGAFAGVVTADLSLADLSAFYALAMPPRRTLYLARDDGVMLLSWPARTAEIGSYIPDTSPWYAIAAAGGGMYNAPDIFSAVPIIAAVQPLHDLPLVIEASCLQSDALVQWRRQRIFVALGGMVTALSAIAVLWLFGRQYRLIEASEHELASKNHELDLAREQLQVTLANLALGVCFFDEHNRLLVHNARFCELIGLAPEEVRVGMSTAEIAEMRIAAGTFWDITLEQYLATLNARRRAGAPVDEISELSDGRTISKHFRPLPRRGWVMTLEDISERRAAEKKIDYLAHHDLLTGLANRALFRDQLGRAIIGSAKGFAMLCLDLDRFKAVNDTYGHPVGDGLLLAVADRLRAAVRGGDTVARMGGDEFVILQLNVSGEPETIALASRIVQAISKPFVIDGHMLSIGVSIGIAMARKDRLDPERLFQEADQALYSAKQAGRGTWRISDDIKSAREPANADTEDQLIAGLS